MLWKPGVKALGAGGAPVNAITRVPAGPETWLRAVPIDTNTAAKITNTDTSRAIPARQNDSCFTRNAYK